MKLNIGILGKKSPGWEFLLRQEGVAYEYLRDVPDNDYPVIIVTEYLEGRRKEFIREYLRDGGGVMCSARNFEALSNQPSLNRNVRFIYPENGSFAEGMGILDLDNNCSVFPGANCLNTDANLNSVFLDEWGGGHIVLLPFEPDEFVFDGRVKTKSFYAGRKRLPFESVSLVNRSALRILISRSLEVLHHRRGLPYIHIWYYPEDQATIFIFRVDTDYSEQAAINKLYEVCRQQNVSASWFIDVKSQESILQYFTQMEDQELGLHCYEHKVFKDIESNRNNIRRALEILQRAGIKPFGFAAPFGAWNEIIAEALQEFRFEYTSEFSYDYDNLPSFLDNKTGTLSSLQIPVHPMSIGGLKRQGFDQNEMWEYYSSIVERKYANHDPLFFYHHPNDGNEEVLSEFFNSIVGKNIPIMTMYEYSQWWKQRDQVRFTATLDHDTLAVTTGGPIENIMLRATQPGEKEAFIVPAGAVSLSGISWSAKPAVVSLPADYLKVREWNWWIPLIRTEDILSKLLR